MEIHVKLFGKFTVLVNQKSVTTLSAKAAELFVYLLLFKNQLHTRETLATLLWEENSAAQSKKYLRQALWHLQATLGGDEKTMPPLLLVDNASIQINPAASICVDVEQFSRHATALQGLSSTAVSKLAMDQLQEALTLYQDELLGNWYQDWCLLERERLQAMYRALVDKLVAACLDNGQFELGIAHCLQLLQKEPTREKTHCQLMRLYDASQDRTSALRQYKLCQTILKQELNVEPATLTKALYDYILADTRNKPIPTQSPSHLIEIQTLASNTKGIDLFSAMKDIMGEIIMLKNELNLIRQTLAR